MAEAIRKASARWEGDLATGKGTVTADTTKIFVDQPISWKARTEDAGGKTGPEELLAAAHAACFSMALSHELANAKTPAQKLETQVEVTFGPIPGGFKVKSSAITVTGWVKGLDAAGFTKAAESAKENCPMSAALKGNVALSVKAKLGS